MKKLLILFVLLTAFAHAQYLPVTASGCIVDGSGATIANGTMTIVGTDANGNAIPYRAGSSFQVVTSPITRTITAGSLATSLQLADPTASSPLNILYKFAITDKITNKSTVYKNVVIVANDSGNFNFCKYNPTISILPSLATGYVAHNLLDNLQDQDTTANAPVRGSVIIANSTPKWTALGIGVNGTFLGSNGTDVSWLVPPSAIVSSVFGRTGTVVAVANDYAFSQLSGIFAKAQSPATAVYTDQANTFGAFIQTFQVGSNHSLVDPTDITKKFQFDASNISTATTRIVNVPNANSTFVQSINAISHNFLTSMNSQGLFSQAQPACADISNASASCTIDTSNASNIGSGTLAGTRLPTTAVQTNQANTFGAFIQTFQAGINHLLVDPTDTTKKFQFDVSNVATGTTRNVNVPNANSTFVQSIASVSHQFLTSMNSQGLLAQAQPAFNDISGLVAAAQLPNPTSSSLGGIQSIAAVTHKWLNTISTSGVPSATQPACSDISDAVASCSTDTTNASNITTGIMSEVHTSVPFLAKTTTYTAADGDRGSHIRFASCSSPLFNLPQAGLSSLFISGWYVYITNNCSANVTVTPSVSQINDVATWSIRPEQGIMIVSNGSNYFAFGFNDNPTYSQVTGTTAVVSNGSFDTTTTAGCYALFGTGLVGSQGQICIDDGLGGPNGDGIGTTKAIILPDLEMVGIVQISGNINFYKQNLVDNGIPGEVQHVDLTAQGAAITATNIIASVPTAGMYRVCYVATVTRAATTSSVLGGTNGFQIVYTDSDTSVVKTLPGTIVAGVDSNSSNSTSTSTISNCYAVYAKVSTAIQYKFDYTSVGTTTMQFNLHVKAESM